MSLPNREQLVDMGVPSADVADMLLRLKREEAERDCRVACARVANVVDAGEAELDRKLDRELARMRFDAQIECAQIAASAVVQAARIHEKFPEVEAAPEETADPHVFTCPDCGGHEYRSANGLDAPKVWCGAWPRKSASCGWEGLIAEHVHHEAA